MSFERSYLFVAGTDRQGILDAAHSATDVIIVDLEDTVLPSRKGTARETTLETISDLQTEDTKLAVRVNGLDTEFGIEDIRTIATSEARPDLLVVPDVRDAGELSIVDDVLDDYGVDVGIHPLIENPGAVFDARNIAHVSERVHGLTFAAIDFQMNMGMSILDDNDFSVPRYLLSMAANDAGVRIVDKPNLAAVHDPDRTRSEAMAARSVGYDGKIAMTERQAEIINDVFTPSESEIQRAKQYIESFEAAGEGLVEIDGALVDKPVIDQLRDTLERARQAGIEI